MHKDIAEPGNIPPGNLRMPPLKLLRLPLRGFGQGLQFPQHRALGLPILQNASRPSAVNRSIQPMHFLGYDPNRPDPFSYRNRLLQDLWRKGSRMASGSTTSTGRPRNCSSSATSPPGNQGVVGPATSTRRSTSLPSLLSPRAAEPNTRILATPCLAAIRRISSRFSFGKLSIPIGTTVRTPRRRGRSLWAHAKTQRTQR